jgi:hypothetical protein
MSGPKEMIIVKDYLDPKDFEFVQEYARNLDYTGAKNPEDGVVYPDINTQVPQKLRDYIEGTTGFKIRTTFFRLTCATTGTAPHQAHTDSVMGKYTLLLYMQDGPGGTSLVRHKETGMDEDPDTVPEIEAWRKDTNNAGAWEAYQLFTMEANKAVLFPSRLMHRAEPIKGFGNSAKDGRIVFIAFLDDA